MAGIFEMKVQWTIRTMAAVHYLTLAFDHLTLPTEHAQIESWRNKGYITVANNRHVPWTAVQELFYKGITEEAEVDR
jgi:hypothetical protein